MTDRRSLDSQGSVAPLRGKIQESVSAGVDWVQVREKDLPPRELASVTQAAMRASAASHTRILVNDRVDVALAERTGGVHLPENGLPIAEVRRLLQTTPSVQDSQWSFLIGASCHSPQAASQAQKEGADYIFFGPVFGTPSKEQYGPSQGISRLQEVCRCVAIPVLAIGGITLENAPSCIAAGAAGLAAIRLFQGAENLVKLIQALHQLRI